MWLINTTTLQLEYFHVATSVRYAILSHTWGDDELTYQEMRMLEKHEEKIAAQKKDLGSQQTRTILSTSWKDELAMRGQPGQSEAKIALSLIYEHLEQGCHAQDSHRQNSDDWKVDDASRAERSLDPCIAEITKKSGFLKIHACCQQASSDGIGYAWIDTCCIDKASSTELSEAINSMFSWYKNSTICYAYLSDIPYASDVIDPSNNEFDVKGRFERSRWFTRGWTLQELLAPSVVEFYAADWQSFGTKAQLREQISMITGINTHALYNGVLSQFNVAERMSWAAKRQTTRSEDRAYCLLGIFEVNMPLLYGEGRRAFQRLQESIIQVVEDYTILAWPGRHYDTNVQAIIAYEDGESGTAAGGSLFAQDPLQFTRLDGLSWNYSDLKRIQQVDYINSTHMLSIDSLPEYASPPSVTARGIQLSLPLMDLGGRNFLGCLYHTVGPSKKLVCIPLIRDELEPEKFARDYRCQPSIHLVDFDLSPKFQRQRIYGMRLLCPERVESQSRDLFTSALEEAKGNCVSRFRTQRGHSNENKSQDSAITLIQRIYGIQSGKPEEFVFSLLKHAAEIGSESYQFLLGKLLRFADERLSEGSYYPKQACEAPFLMPNWADYVCSNHHSLLRAACELHLDKEDLVIVQVRIMQAAYLLLSLNKEDAEGHAEQALQAFESRLPQLSATDFTDDLLIWAEEAARDWSDAEQVLEKLNQLATLYRGWLASTTKMARILQLYVLKGKKGYEGKASGRWVLWSLPLHFKKSELGWEVTLQAVLRHFEDEFDVSLPITNKINRAPYQDSQTFSDRSMIEELKERWYSGLQ